ncbi:UNVERIFIED_CONTAM: Anthocyanidin 3-O-glucoside 6''-O-acyltransferase [Sesamum angustifolium]|uniref:Anthocyanidin 3-O-glucoside 6''-O-acyltransferase n=1 Tax=Sesamum angustifolium TaxID=2727405 RepID=A0AAW2IMI0_9LAMI
MATKLEECKIHPSFDTDDNEFSLPLTHFDIPFFLCNPTERLIFFDFPCSKRHFLDTVVPDLKKSLARTLTHFLALAGNIIIPLDFGMPVSRYVSGDSVSLTIVQCDRDYQYLTGNHQRVADEFYACVPQLPPASRFPDSFVLPAMVLQVTLFPGQGICLGLTNNHVVGDESSIVNFVKSWAIVNKFDSDVSLIDQKSFPVFYRNGVQDPWGLDSRAWNIVRKSRFFSVDPQPPPFPIDRVRATFILTKNQVQNLKNYVSANKPNLRHISSFSVICAYVWTCSEKCLAAAAGRRETNDDDLVYLPFAADCRQRLSPPLLSTYFGNCVVYVIAESRHGLLKGDEGFLIAAQSVGEAITETLYSEKEILDSAGWPVDFGEYFGRRYIGVAGSPKFDVYEADFGWGRPKSYEFAHIDRERYSISLCKSREFEGGFEIGLSRMKMDMDVFEAVFNQGLQIIEKF